ncbi:MAG: alpha/beta hydrolase [Pseudomonadota bacterium]
MAYTKSFDGLNIFYDVAGEGAPLLIINGFGPPCEWMAEMYGKHFEGRFQYAVSDLRGVGQSDAPPNMDTIDLSDFARDHLSVMDAMGWERAHIYGGSMGASIATELSILAPDRVRSVALGSLDCGYPNVMSRSFADVLRARVRYGKSIKNQEVDPEGAAEIILEMYYGDKTGDAHPLLRDFIVDMLTRYPMVNDFPPLKVLASLPDDISSLIEALPETAEPVPSSAKPRRDFITGDLWERLEKVVPPTLLLHGMDDPLIPYQSAVYAASKISRSELRLYNSMFHSISGSPQILKDIGDWMLRQPGTA